MAIILPAHPEQAGGTASTNPSPAQVPQAPAELAKGGEGPPVMGAGPAWPEDSLRAGIGVVLALCRQLLSTSLKAGPGYPPREAASAFYT